MKQDITYHWGEEHLLVKLGNRIEPRIRFLFIAEFLLTSGLATIFLVRSLPLSTSVVHWVTGIASSVIYLLAAYRCFSRIFFKETLLADQHGLTIIRRTPFFQQTTRYSWHNMGAIHYVGKHVKTDHPLKGKSFDYLGFETQEHLIQSLHHKGNLFFCYAGEEVRFARGVYSWDAEKLVYMIQLYAGAVFRLGPEWEDMLQEHEIDANR
jgi:hypothetical protein